MSQEATDTKRLIDATQGLAKRLRQLERQESVLPGLSVFFSSQNIPDAVSTPIEWTQIYPNSIFYADPLNLERIYIRNQRGAQNFGVFGWSFWESNANGYRSVDTDAFDAGGGALGDLTCGFRVGAVNGSYTSVPLCGHAYGIDPEGYFIMNAYQNSGGARLCLFAIACFLLT